MAIRQIVTVGNIQPEARQGVLPEVPINREGIPLLVAAARSVAVVQAVPLVEDARVVDSPVVVIPVVEEAVIANT